MDPRKFINTIYLGDRACKNILLDGWTDRVVFEVDLISRIRSESGRWEYYTDEDIPGGLIVFTGVVSTTFEHSGPLPNDQIEFVAVEAAHDYGDNETGAPERFLFTIAAVANVTQASPPTFCQIRIE